MVEKNNVGPESGNLGSIQEQHVEAGPPTHGNDGASQSDSFSDQPSDSTPAASEQSERQPTPVQQPDTRLNESHEPGSLSVADVQGGLSGQHTTAGRQSD